MGVEEIIFRQKLTSLPNLVFSSIYPRQSTIVVHHKEYGMLMTKEIAVEMNVFRASRKTSTPGGSRCRRGREGTSILLEPPNFNSMYGNSVSIGAAIPPPRSC